MLRKNTKSFEQWCVENNKESYLELWDYEKNILKPSEVPYSNSSKKFYFKCKDGKHDSFLKGINNLIHSKDLICPQCNSFYEWCLNNNKQYLIKMWDNLHNEDIHYISKASGIKCWFIINDECKYAYCLNDVTHNENSDPLKKYFNSVGYFLISNYGEDSIKLYWSDKNTKSPYEYDCGSNKKVWIKCTQKDYHNDYQVQCSSFTKNNHRCPECASKITNKNDSFAQFNIDRYGDNWLKEYYCDDNEIDPYTLSRCSHKKVHIKCMSIDYHDFWISAYNYDKKENVCPYCKRQILHIYDSFGYKHPELIKYWSTKNIIDAYSIPEYYHGEVWFKCDNGIHEDFKRRIYNCTESHKGIYLCPKCNRETRISSFQKKLEDYFDNSKYNLLHEYDCSIIPINPKTGCRLPLDNEVIELKLIIEVNGKQHYEVTGFEKAAASHKNITPEEELEYTKWKDEFKKNYVLSQGYHYLEIPYTAFNSNEYINIIENKLSEIQSLNSIN